jgi:hypothetical protein
MFSEKQKISLLLISSTVELMHLKKNRLENFFRQNLVGLALSAENSNQRVWFVHVESNGAKIFLVSSHVLPGPASVGPTFSLDKKKRPTSMIEKFRTSAKLVKNLGKLWIVAHESVNYYQIFGFPNRKLFGKFSTTELEHLSVKNWREGSGVITEEDLVLFIFLVVLKSSLPNFRTQL